jgi:hypothetical protein
MSTTGPPNQIGPDDLDELRKLLLVKQNAMADIYHFNKMEQRIKRKCFETTQWCILSRCRLGEHLA